MASRIGRYTLRLENKVSLTGFASVVGKKEKEGPLGDCFDIANEDTTFGQDSWEKSESQMQQQAVKKALEKAEEKNEDISYILAGDLLNQCISSTYGLRDFGIPFIGMYGACSTMAETLGMASILTESGMAEKCVCVTSSHFCSAERQFRLPLEYGGQRPPTAQWTATAAGSIVTAPGKKPPFVRHVTFGAIRDMGVTDPNNMGAAMAPAAAWVISQFFNDTATSAADYDVIITGDLGKTGSELLYQLLQKDHISIEQKHKDCGLLLYDREKQDVHAGGSGCGCSASVLCGHFLPKVQNGELQNILFIATGALMSTTISQQGESIPSVAHLVHISAQ